MITWLIFASLVRYIHVHAIAIIGQLLKLSETVEKGKHPEKFGLAEDKTGPEREYILQVGITWNYGCILTKLVVSPLANVSR